MRSLPVRLPPGADLRLSLEAQELQKLCSGSAFVICGIGSLIDLRLRLAGASTEISIPGETEILSLSGTISPQGSHLHIAVADAKGQVYGGHLCLGSKIRTTVELLLAWDESWSLGRAQDKETGYKELVIFHGKTPPP